MRRFAFVIADRDMDPDDLVHDALVRLLARGSADDIDVPEGAFADKAG